MQVPELPHELKDMGDEPKLGETYNARQSDSESEKEVEDGPQRLQIGDLFGTNAVIDEQDEATLPNRNGYFKVSEGLLSKVKKLGDKRGRDSDSHSSGKRGKRRPEMLRVEDCDSSSGSKSASSPSEKSSTFSLENMSQSMLSTTLDLKERWK